MLKNTNILNVSICIHNDIYRNEGNLLEESLVDIAPKQCSDLNKRIFTVEFFRSFCHNVNFSARATSHIFKYY